MRWRTVVGHIADNKLGAAVNLRVENLQRIACHPEIVSNFDGNHVGWIVRSTRGKRT